MGYSHSRMCGWPFTSKTRGLVVEAEPQQKSCRCAWPGYDAMTLKTALALAMRLEST
jgi:hypothetical protein